jgi:hypothetical protein
MASDPFSANTHIVWSVFFPDDQMDQLVIQGGLSLSELQSHGSARFQELYLHVFQKRCVCIGGVG